MFLNSNITRVWASNSWPVWILISLFSFFTRSSTHEVTWQVTCCCPIIKSWSRLDTGKASEACLLLYSLLATGLSVVPNVWIANLRTSSQARRSLIRRHVRPTPEIFVCIERPSPLCTTPKIWSSDSGLPWKAWKTSAFTTKVFGRLRRADNDYTALVPLYYSRLWKHDRSENRQA